MVRQTVSEKFKSRSARGAVGAEIDEPAATPRTRGASRGRRDNGVGASGDLYSVTVPSRLPARVPGGDHLLLAAFPLAVSRPGRAGIRLKERLVPGKPYKVIQDKISCAKTGRSVTRTLEVYGSKGGGGASDEDVLIALIQFTHEYLASSPNATLLITDQEIMRSGGDPLSVMMRLRKIHFKRADLLRRLGITHLSGKNQQLLEQRMHRLSGVDLTVRNAYFQSDGALVDTVGLRLIDSYAFIEGNRYAWFAWSPSMAQLIESGELRALDTDFYFRIQDFLARRLFRHLNIFGKPGKAVYSFSEIVKTRLGLEPSTEYVSKCKDPVERACRELVRLGFLKAYAIDGRFVSDATIILEMPPDYQPSDLFALPFEALIDSFRRDADGGEQGEPVARGGLWREETARLQRLSGRSARARDACAELTRALYDRHGPSAAALRHAIEAIEMLGQCGIRAHTAIPETLRLIEAGALTPNGLASEAREVIDWWTRKRQRGEQVGPGLLVAALRDPMRARDATDDTVERSDSRPAALDTGARQPPEPSAQAVAVWGALRDSLEAKLGSVAARDWLDPVVAIGLSIRPADAKQGSSASGRPVHKTAAGGELTLWVPNATFSSYLSGSTGIGQALRSEAARLGVDRIAFATDGG
jgi:hypothetical protein